MLNLAIGIGRPISETKQNDGKSEPANRPFLCGVRFSVSHKCQMASHSVHWL